MTTLADVAPAADEITQGYGCTQVTTEWLDNDCATRRFHSGIDLGHTLGGWHIYRTPAIATREASVVAVGASVAAGLRVDPNYVRYLGDQAVTLRVGGGLYLLYAHLDSASVAVGQRVLPGQMVGRIGTKGNSTAPHLHLEARTDGPYQPSYVNSIDSKPYLDFGGNELTEDQIIALVVIPQGHVQHVLSYGNPMDAATQQALVAKYKAGQLNLGDQFASWYTDGQKQGRAYPQAPARLSAFDATITPKALAQ